MSTVTKHLPSAAPGKSDGKKSQMSRSKLIELLNEDLAREYQARRKEKLPISALPGLD